MRNNSKKWNSSSIGTTRKYSCLRTLTLRISPPAPTNKNSTSKWIALFLMLLPSWTKRRGKFLSHWSSSSTIWLAMKFFKLSRTRPSTSRWIFMGRLGSFCGMSMMIRIRYGNRWLRRVWTCVGSSTKSRQSKRKNKPIPKQDWNYRIGLSIKTAS